MRDGHAARGHSAAEVSGRLQHAHAYTRPRLPVRARTNLHIIWHVAPLNFCPYVPPHNRAVTKLEAQLGVSDNELPGGKHTVDKGQFALSNYDQSILAHGPPKSGPGVFALLS